MKLSRIALGLAIAGLSFGANATNGYFGHGYGMKAKGMAGASTTSTDDAFFGANNPAAAAFAGNRIDLGVDLFSPIRESTSTGFLGGPDVTSESDSNYFLVPEFGYNKMINPNLALGVTVYGNGGMNTDYAPIPGTAGICGPAETNLLCGQGRLGVDLMQLVIAPTAAYKIAPNHSIGISPLLGYQRFKAEGLQGFGIAKNPMDPTSGNLGYDDAFGYGVRVGYLGKITPTVTIGAAYASKMNFEEFDKYKYLFAEQGDFDIPENYNIGVSWQATPQIKVALDYQRINYTGVKSVSNPLFPNLFTDNLGDDNGPGFGWDDMNVWKLGVEYKYSKAWTFRAGYSHTDSPIESSNFCANFADFSGNCMETTFNIIAPAVIEDHATLGFTYTLASGNELTVAYMHGFENDVTDQGFFAAPFETTKIKMHQNSLGVQYSWKM